MYILSFIIYCTCHFIAKPIFFSRQLARLELKLSSDITMILSLVQQQMTLTQRSLGVTPQQPPDPPQPPGGGTQDAPNTSYSLGDSESHVKSKCGQKPQGVSKDTQTPVGASSQGTSNSLRPSMDPPSPPCEGPPPNSPCEEPPGGANIALSLAQKDDLPLV